MRLPGRPTPSVVTNCVSYAEGLLAHLLSPKTGRYAVMASWGSRALVSGEPVLPIRVTPVLDLQNRDDSIRLVDPVPDAVLAAAGGVLALKRR